VFGQARVAAVEPAAAHALAKLERELARGRPADLGLDRESPRAAADASVDLAGAEAAGGRGQIGRLEQAGLAAAVGPQQEQGPLRRAPVEAREAAEVAEAEPAERDRFPVGRAVRSASA